MKTRQLSIRKLSGQRYVVRWQRGQEADAIDALAAMAADERTDFDWIDAACLAYEIGRHGWLRPATGDGAPIHTDAGL